MEYRGYDSAGVAVMNGSGVETRKAAGKISELERALATRPVAGDLGIGHTRWATHGVPNECNAHPHIDCKGNVAVVHNGIIENASVLRAELEKHGHTFVSETDTEVIAHLIEEAFDGNLEDAVIEALWQIEGTYGIAVNSHPGALTGPVDHYLDPALDFQYERPFGANLLDAHGTWIHERVNLNATLAAGGAEVQVQLARDEKLRCRVGQGGTIGEAPGQLVGTGAELRIVDELSYEQVASSLECSEVAARIRVTRALGSLSRRLKGAPS